MTLHDLLSRHRWIAAPSNVANGLLTPGRWNRALRALADWLRLRSGIFDDDGVAVAAIRLTAPLRA